MSISSREINQPAEEFRRCRKRLLALGADPCQRLILKMMQIEDRSGVRSNIITEQSSLSRPARLPPPQHPEGCRPDQTAVGGHKKLLLF